MLTRALIAALIALPALGCASTPDDTTRQLDELRAELARLRSVNAALADRVDVIEMRQGREREVRDTVTARPALPVVKLAPTAPAAVEDPAALAEEAPRVELRSASGGRVVVVSPAASAAPSPIPPTRPIPPAQPTPLPLPCPTCDQDAPY